MSTPDEVLAYWLDEVGPEGWYVGGAELDAAIRDRFARAWDRASEGGLSLWQTYSSGTLAYILLTDQFPRNMYRDDARSFALDRVALAAAKMAISRGWDLKIDEPARQFFYLPLMHSEILSDQDRCVRLILTRLPEHGAPNLLHARAHREVIRRFGRFPHRNVALNRQTRPAEQEYINRGGYGATVNEMREAA